LFIRDPDPDFVPFPDPGSKGQKGTGSRIRIRNTEQIRVVLDILERIVRASAADPGSSAFLTPGSGMGKKSRSGSEINIPDHIFESLETMVWEYKYLNSLMRIRIRDPKYF
jgi:hypothetical protein